VKQQPEGRDLRDSVEGTMTLSFDDLPSILEDGAKLAALNLATRKAILETLKDQFPEGDLVVDDIHIIDINADGTVDYWVQVPPITKAEEERSKKNAIVSVVTKETVVEGNMETMEMVLTNTATKALVSASDIEVSQVDSDGTVKYTMMKSQTIVSDDSANLIKVELAAAEEGLNADDIIIISQLNSDGTIKYKLKPGSTKERTSTSVLREIAKLEGIDVDSMSDAQLKNIIAFTLISINGTVQYTIDYEKEVTATDVIDALAQSNNVLSSAIETSHIDTSTGKVQYKVKADKKAMSSMRTPLIGNFSSSYPFASASNVDILSIAKTKSFAKFQLTLQMSLTKQKLKLG
jgi:hypothetical protein